MAISPSLASEFLDAHTDVQSCRLRQRYAKLHQGVAEVHGDSQSHMGCHEFVVGAGCHQMVGTNPRCHPRTQSPRALAARQGRAPSRARSACTTSFQRLEVCIIQQGARSRHTLLLSRDTGGFTLADICFSGIRTSYTILKHRRHRDCHKENDPFLNVFLSTTRTITILACGRASAKPSFLKSHVNCIQKITSLDSLGAKAAISNLPLHDPLGRRLRKKGLARYR